MKSPFDHRNRSGYEPPQPHRVGAQNLARLQSILVVPEGHNAGYYVPRSRHLQHVRVPALPEGMSSPLFLGP